MWRVFAEMNFSEIGCIFGKSENWACVTYHRSRKMIIERMEKMVNECKIVRDQLPIVEENIASRESCDFVREHISSCDECKNEADELKSNAVSIGIEED